MAVVFDVCITCICDVCEEALIIVVSVVDCDSDVDCKEVLGTVVCDVGFE